jgi:hypothetical protein
MFFDTVDSVVKSFTKQINKLNKLADKHQKNYEFHKNASVEHGQLASNEAQESVRAQKIASNIQKLLEV